MRRAAGVTQYFSGLAFGFRVGIDAGMSVKLQAVTAYQWLLVSIAQIGLYGLNEARHNQTDSNYSTDMMQ